MSIRPVFEDEKVGKGAFWQRTGRERVVRKWFFLRAECEVEQITIFAFDGDPNDLRFSRGERKWVRISATKEGE